MSASYTNYLEPSLYDLYGQDSPPDERAYPSFSPLGYGVARPVTPENFCYIGRNILGQGNIVAFVAHVARCDICRAFGRHNHNGFYFIPEVCEYTYDYLNALFSYAGPHALQAEQWRAHVATCPTCNPRVVCQVAQNLARHLQEAAGNVPRVQSLAEQVYQHQLTCPQCQRALHLEPNPPEQFALQLKNHWSKP